MILETVITVGVIVAILFIILLLVVKGKQILSKMKLFKLKVLLMVRKDAAARGYALKIVDKYPQNYLAHKILGMLYEKEENYAAALDEYIKVVELNSGDYDMHYKVAQLFQMTNKNDNAIIMLQDLLRIKPDFVKASLLLGSIYYDEERFKDAVSVYTSALKYSPIEYELYYSMGMAFTRLNDFQRAKEFYKKAAKLNTFLYNGQYNLALIALIQGELDTAEARLLKAINEEDLQAIGYFYLAQIAMLRNEPENALNYLNLALEIDKTIEERISEQPLFLPIQDRIRIPKEPTRKIKITLTEKEIKTNDYLEKMYNLVDSLNSGNFSKTEDTQQIELEQQENEKER